jgi:uroporphyrinogen-III synthase
MVVQQLLGSPTVLCLHKSATETFASGEAWVVVSSPNTTDLLFDQVETRL